MMNRRTALSFVLAALLLGRFAQADVVPVTEVFGMASDGTVLHWVAYTPTTPGPWPVVLVIHGGGFYSGKPFELAGVGGVRAGFSRLRLSRAFD